MENSITHTNLIYRESCWAMTLLVAFCSQLLLPQDLRAMHTTMFLVYFLLCGAKTVENIKMLADIPFSNSVEIKRNIASWAENECVLFLVVVKLLMYDSVLCQSYCAAFTINTLLFL